MEHFKLLSLPARSPDYNIPPGQEILAVVQLEDGSNKAVDLLWGLIPSWSKERPAISRLINARAETVSEKPSFKHAFQYRRCLIPATGFFEWQNTASGKRPYHIHKPDNSLFAFAGLWEHWRHEQQTIYSCAIITTLAGDQMTAIHSRMPAIIAPKDYDRWLAKNNTVIEMSDFLNDEINRTMQITPISTRVNNPLHNDENCLR
ncbi:MAG: SOS response-associated peptidase [Methylobacter sp.]